MDKQRLIFQKIALIVLIALFLLIVIGSSVRSSGAGMGCPDWPTCFGHWIPPTDESQLPANYQQIFKGYETAKFNVVKTWTEYFNRLAGIIFGILVIALAVASVPLRNRNKSLFVGSWLALALVCLQGWIGAQVVESELTPGVISLHMAMAMLIVVIVSYLVVRSRTGFKVDVVPPVRSLMGVSIGLLLLQIFMGTQVREMVDFITNQGDLSRSTWASALPWFFNIHRSFSIVVLLFHMYLVWRFFQIFSSAHVMRYLGGSLLVGIVIVISSGAALNHLNFPAFVQPVHLVMAMIIVSLQTAIWVRIR